MASPNAGPITGSELIRVIQDGTAVYLNRNEFAQLLNYQAVYSPRPFKRPTTLSGGEVFEAIQYGTRITMNAADIAAFLAGSGPIQAPPGARATGFSGIEQVPALQAGYEVGLNLADLATVRGGGGAVTDLLPGGGSGGGGGSGSPSVVVPRVLVTRSGDIYTFTADRTTNLSVAEAIPYRLAASTNYPPSALASDYPGGTFPTFNFNFAAGSSVGQGSVVSAVAQPE